MNVTTYARGMAAYNQWMNEKIYSCCAQLSDEVRKRDMGAFLVFNHQTHHRGQVTTLLKQLGIDPGPTDLPVMPGIIEVMSQASSE